MKSKVMVLTSPGCFHRLGVGVLIEVRQRGGGVVVGDVSDPVLAVVGGALEVTTGLTASAPSIVGNKVTSLLSGGTAEQTYRVSCRVTTTLGETLELDVDVKVIDGAN